jgi:cytidylate kinase
MAIITISRGSMSGGEALAGRLAEKLGYPSVGREVIVAAAEKLGVEERFLSEKFMRSPGLWERMTSNRRLYLVAVQAALAEHAAKGDLIYHGNAGHLLLRGIRSVLRVRLIAPLDLRIRAVMESKKTGLDAAERYIRQVDEERIRWTKFIYGVDWTDPFLYDLSVNLERMSMDTACLVIAEAVRQPEFATTREVEKELSDFLLACRVKLAWRRTPNPDFDVDVGRRHSRDPARCPAQMLSHTITRDEWRSDGLLSVGGVALSLNVQRYYVSWATPTRRGALARSQDSSALRSLRNRFPARPSPRHQSDRDRLRAPSRRRSEQRRSAAQAVLRCR